MNWEYVFTEKTGLCIGMKLTCCLKRELRTNFKMAQQSSWELNCVFKKIIFLFCMIQGWDIVSISYEDFFLWMKLTSKWYIDHGFIFSCLRVCVDTARLMKFSVHFSEVLLSQSTNTKNIPQYQWVTRKSSVSGILDWKVSSKTTVCTEKKPSPFLTKSMGSMGPREWNVA